MAGRHWPAASGGPARRGGLADWSGSFPFFSLPSAGALSFRRRRDLMDRFSHATDKDRYGAAIAPINTNLRHQTDCPLKRRIVIRHAESMPNVVRNLPHWCRLRQRELRTKQVTAGRVNTSQRAGERRRRFRLGRCRICQCVTRCPSAPVALRLEASSSRRRRALDDFLLFPSCASRVCLASAFRGSREKLAVHYRAAAAESSLR